MGFSCISVKVVSKLVRHLQDLLAHVKFIVIMALSSLSQFNLFDQLYAPPGHQADVVLPANLPSPALVPVPVTLSPIMLEPIKKRLPVVRFGDFLDRLGVTEDSEPLICVVCLSFLERNHEIRELSNCSHVFHRECLDKWIDHCQMTCPSCRCKLVPTQGERDPWMVERMYYLFGEDW